MKVSIGTERAAIATDGKLLMEKCGGEVLRREVRERD